jgi:8-oxo-dGTP pyrophosphatase MutT (NUDIX family)
LPVCPGRDYKLQMARQERSAGFITYHGGRSPGDEVEYLLLDYGRYWDFPKGHVDGGEDDLAAALRELHEETGIAPTDARVVPGFRREISYFFRDRGKGLVHKTVVFFLAEVMTRDVTLSEEHVAHEFLSYPAAAKRATYASAKELLRLAHEHLTAVSAAPRQEPTECPPEGTGVTSGSTEGRE